MNVKSYNLSVSFYMFFKKSGMFYLIVKMLFLEISASFEAVNRFS